MNDCRHHHTLLEQIEDRQDDLLARLDELNDRTEQLLSELKAAGTPDLAMLAVTNRQLKSMVAS